jgi:hypothetical protein
LLQLQAASAEQADEAAGLADALQNLAAFIEYKANQ